MITLRSKQEEYTLMETSQKRTVEVEIPNGPKTVWLGSWDYKADLEGMSFKTLSEPKITHAMLETIKVDLHPISNTKFWAITIRRYGKPAS